MLLDTNFLVCNKWITKTITYNAKIGEFSQMCLFKLSEKCSTIKQWTGYKNSVNTEMEKY